MIRALVSLTLNLIDHHTWASGVRHIDSDTDIIGRWVDYQPRSAGRWPYREAADIHPLSRVADALEAAKPSNVLKLMGAGQ